MVVFYGEMWSDCLVEQATVFRGGGCSSEIQLLERMKNCTDYNIK